MDFLSKVFGGHTGHLCVVTIQDKKQKQAFFKYPDDLYVLDAELDRWNSANGANVYFFPVLVEEPDMESEIVCSPVVSADLDMVSPILVDPIPDVIVESSPGRFQTYWFRANRDEFTPVSVNGPVPADLKLMRLPGTRNWKYGNEPWSIREIDPGQLDTYERMATRRKLHSSGYSYLFRTNDRRTLARLCARRGCTATETYLALAAAQVNAEQSPGADGYQDVGALYREALEAVSSSSVPDLLTDDEVEGLVTQPAAEPCFVDRYVEWATSCTDSPKQYHIAGALTVLSILLSPHICMATSFNDFRCNLWFMILGETTSTRKTTAMEMAVKIAECVEPNVLLSTDGTAEGIISALANRDGESSLFFRDEISGFFDETVNKRYMSGILEMFTRLYDGSKTKRTPKSKVVEVNNPYLIMLMGGIKDNTIEILDAKHMLSGFLPRFLIVCGLTREEDIRPIGPPNAGVLNMKGDLLHYLDGLVGRYVPPKRSSLNGKVNEPLAISATDDAWERMRKLEKDARELGKSSESPNIYGPLFDRCKNSIIKVAILLTADRAYRENVVPVMDVSDLVHAISYSGVWIQSMCEIARGIDDKPSKDELRIIKIEAAIRDSETGFTRSQLMRKFRLAAKEMNEIEATLIGRGLVIGSSVNKATVYRTSTREVPQ